MATPYLTPAQLRDRVPALAEAARFPDEDLAGYIAEFEELVESYRGVAFTPREATESVDLPPPGATRVRLDWPEVVSITSVTIDEVISASDTYRLTSDGVLVVAGEVTLWTGTEMTVVYEHGFPSPGPALLRACREYVRATALADRSNLGRDVIRQSAGDMTTQYSTPNPAEGRPTGFLEVDRIINLQPNHRLTVGVG
jgi:hypothetical protein